MDFELDNGPILTLAGAAVGLDFCLLLVCRDSGAQIVENSFRFSRTNGRPNRW